MKMNKKIAGLALVTLLAPTILTAQQAFAETSTTAESTQQTAPTVDSSTIESLPLESTTIESTAASTSDTVFSSESTTSESTVEESASAETSTSTTETTSSSEEKKESKATKVSVPVHFIDESGAPISSTTLTGEVGKTASTSIPKGYAVSIISAPGFDTYAIAGVIYLSGILSDSMPAITVSLYATSSPGADINLVDQEGLPVLGVQGTFYVGNINDSFTFIAPEVRGYRLVGNPTIPVTLTDKLQTIDVVYERITTKLTIICLDTSGNNLMDENQVFEGKFGETGTFTPAWFPGMQLISVNGAPVPDPITVEFTDTDQTMTLVYADIWQEPLWPIDPIPAPSTITPVAPVVEPLNAVLPPVEQKKKSTLPATGEKTNGITLSVLGMTVIAGVYFTKKKRENELKS